LPDKRLQYLITILLISGTPITKDELIEIFSYKNVAFFRDNYLKPLEVAGFISKTNPDKPTAPTQKYVITEKGKRFLTGQVF
jgi:predicted transcriptional regulator